MKRALIVCFDVSALTDEQINALTLEVVVQGERSEGHPDVPVKTELVTQHAPLAKARRAAPLTATAKATLWISNSGRVSCVEHGGAYLEACVRGNPRARTYITPLDHWSRVTATLRAEWLRQVGRPIECEGCEHQATRSAP